MRARFLSFFRFRKRGHAAARQKGRDCGRNGVGGARVFLLLIGSTEMSLIESGPQLLENATFNTSRLAKTGYSAGGETQAQTVNQILDNELQSFGTLFNTGNVTMTETDYNSFTSAATGSAEAPADWARA